MKLEGNPDKFEIKVRFGCGALLGLFIGIFVAARITYESFGAFAVIWLAVIIVCGLLAVRYGDRFWEDLGKWWWLP